MIEFARFPVEEILPFIGLNKPKIQLGAHYVKASSNRLECLHRNQTCVQCKRRGTLFILEQHVQGRRKGSINCFIKDCQLCHHHKPEPIYEVPHLNLYHVGRRGGLTLMTQDHIMPKMHGGGDSLDNLQTMCSVCNQHKGSEIPAKVN